MKKTILGAAAIAASLAISTNSHAAASAAYTNPVCTAAFTPATTTKDGAKCQAAIAKNSSAYVAAVLKVRGACLSLGTYDGCPNSADDLLVQAAAVKAATAIQKACAATDGLGTSYKTTTGADAASCTLSQNHATTQVFLGLTHGTAGFPNSQPPTADDTARNACQVAMNKVTDKYMPSLLKIVDKCIATAVKAGNAATASALCGLGVDSSNALTLPTDSKTATAITKANEKAKASIDKACGGLSATQISDLFSCPYAVTVDDLKTCIVGSAARATCQIANQQYGETGDLLTTADSIQSAVNAATPGTKFLIASGTYTEGITLPNGKCGPLATNAGTDCLSDSTCTGDTCQSTADNLQFVGCGAATDDRPIIEPPSIPSPPLRAFIANGVDGLLFQGLDVKGWGNDGIFVTSADGVTFRDDLGDGDDQSTPNVIDPVSTYAFFPIQSNNVVVEACIVINVRDAGIYVGQSTNTTARYNYIHANVAGLEIENSDTADVYGNTAFDNVGGLLNFKLPGLPKQTSGGHHFFDNVCYSNNRVNFGIPGTTVGNVPQGTGMMVISEKNSVFENNIVLKNLSYGFLIIDQNAINILVGPPPLFNPVSVDQSMQGVQFLHNHSSLNGGLPTGLFTSNYTYALADGVNGACFTPVVSGQAVLGVSFLACP